jgi:hypothetical protein
MPDRASAQYALRGRLSPMGSPCGGDPRYAMVLRPANCVAEKDFPEILASLTSRKDFR